MADFLNHWGPVPPILPGFASGAFHVRRNRRGSQGVSAKYVWCASGETQNQWMNRSRFRANSGQNGWDSAPKLFQPTVKLLKNIYFYPLRFSIEPGCRPLRRGQKGKILTNQVRFLTLNVTRGKRPKNGQKTRIEGTRDPGVPGSTRGQASAGGDCHQTGKKKGPSKKALSGPRVLLRETQRDVRRISRSRMRANFAKTGWLSDKYVSN